MALGTYAPDPVFLGTDSNGAPLPGAKLFIYTSGTSTKATTWSETTMTSANANPLILDSAGRGTVVLLPGAAYKFVLAPSTDSDPPSSPYWTRDVVSAVSPPGSSTDNDVAGTAGETLSLNDCVYLSDGSGGKNAGRWYKGDATNTYSSVGATDLAFANAATSVGVAGTFRMSGRVTGLSGLTSGAVHYISGTPGLITATAPANSRAILAADSTTSGVISPWVGTYMPSFSAAPTWRPGISTGAYSATTNGKIFADHTAVNGATGAGTTVLSGTLAGGSISAALKMVRLVLHGTTAANANNKTWAFNWGGATAFTFPTVASNNNVWKLTIEIFRSTGTAAQTMFYALELAPTAGGGTGVVYKDRVAKTKDLTADQAFSVTITSGTTSGDVTYDAGYVEVIG